MNNIKRILLVSILLTSANLFAQVKILTGGNLQLLGASPNNTTCAVFGNSTTNQLFGSKVSIYGYIKPALGLSYYTATDNWGLSSIVTTNQGSTKNWIVDLGGTQHNFFVTSLGAIYYKHTMKMGSDSIFKDNVATVSNPLDIINALRGVSFTYKASAFAKDSAIKEHISSTDVVTKKHYGFIAQEVRTVLPELVDTLQDTTLAVDYVSMISILVEGIKAQQTQIEDMQAQLYICCGGQNALPNKKSGYNNNKNKEQGMQDIKEMGKLQLKKMDAVSAANSVTLNCNVPPENNEAYIYIYDLKGEQLKKLTVDMNNGTALIQKGQLKAGMYLYTLIVNGKEYGTEKLILTE